METEKFSSMLSPFHIGKVEIKNRFVMGPMGISQLYGPHGELNDPSIDFFVERAKGGFGLIIQGAQQADDVVDPGIAASPLGYKNDPGLFRRQAIKLIDRAGSFGTKVFAQISAGLGRNYPGRRAPSSVEVYNFPELKSIEISRSEIAEKVESVIKLASFVKSCGYSGVEIHALHWGYLLDEFAMSITNHRTDEYGGCLENRLRMTREILDGVRAECGKDFPVIIRLGLKSYIKTLNKASFDGSEEAGRTLEEGIEICRKLEEYGFDAIDVDMGVYDSFYYACPPSYIQQGFALDMYAKAKAAVSIPILAGSRMQDPVQAEQAVRDGKIDAVVLSRPSMADPELPRKVQASRPEKIRPCIACCQCFARALDDDRPVTCAVNPDVYRESEHNIKPALQSKHIAVIGGGAGGMEAARLARLCGHTVDLFEKSDRLGGLMHPAGAQVLKKEMSQLIDWYELELKDLGVEVHLNTEVSPDSLKADKYDVIILASGSEPARLGFIPGITKPQVIDCVHALTGQPEIGDRVVVIGGGHVGCEVAMELALNKKKLVTIVEMNDELLKSNPPVPTPVRMCLLDMIDYYHINVRTRSTVQEVLDGSVIVKNSAGDIERIDADTVVLAAGFKANSSMAAAFYGCGAEVYEIGNGLPTANVLQATAEAYEIVTRLS